MKASLHGRRKPDCKSLVYINVISDFMSDVGTVMCSVMCLSLVQLLTRLLPVHDQVGARYMHFPPFLHPDRAPFMLQALVNTWEETAHGTFPAL